MREGGVKRSGSNPPVWWSSPSYIHTHTQVATDLCLQTFWSGSLRTTPRLGQSPRVGMAHTIADKHSRRGFDDGNVAIPRGHEETSFKYFPTQSLNYVPQQQRGKMTSNRNWRLMGREVIQQTFAFATSWPHHTKPPSRFAMRMGKN